SLTVASPPTGRPGPGRRKAGRARSFAAIAPRGRDLPSLAGGHLETSPPLGRPRAPEVVAQVVLLAVRCSSADQALDAMLQPRKPAWLGFAGDHRRRTEAPEHQMRIVAVAPDPNLAVVHQVRLGLARERLCDSQVDVFVDRLDGLGMVAVQPGLH